ncbi:adenosylcobinamide-GDP ribazoletransferase [Acetobacter lambici]|uniref:Adenosylcobinamide-GDP ribazoletransferase n=1 Tax=Acetobacter lambici TaxID=1332824 RepID=A0ABT1F5X0_9PROT|nr:adenosylcobinamide-GDP ribazoletransferase [Acetobacter lambici]MCP1242991.1 adenosylcobinamide-GDP ribazoletransferase [Acetobacter lambici]MCP1259139.1 adenosylcobinamide-GDP ribazoletransferase [Acetobacter lambici]NHO57367.1 adenosylcobinamide-GDP ribazoletransferase [Acetobacter lambici]
MTRTPPDCLFNRCRLDLACGLSLLTRLPANWLTPAACASSTQPWPMARSIWCWPLIAALIGAFTGAILVALRSAHVPALVAAGLALACQTILTGGLHEDGLADMADGCGGATPERRLAIMRDSRVGSYGVMALGLSLLIRVAALAALPIWAGIGACAITACLARMAMLLVPVLTPPARTEGLASMLCPLPQYSLIGALVVTAGVLAGLPIIEHIGADLPAWMYLALIFAPAGISCATALLVATCARRLLGGFTGDVLGCCAVVAECLLLSFYAALA